MIIDRDDDDDDDDEDAGVGDVDGDHDDADGGFDADLARYGCYQHSPPQEHHVTLNLAGCRNRRCSHRWRA